jgi:cytochrome c553
MKRFSAIIAACGCLAASGPTVAEGKADAGREKAEQCAGCHGEDGNSETPIFPKLAGQHTDYLIRQLNDFRAQKRVDPSMNAIAGALGDQDVADLAAYYASQKVQPGQAVENAAGKRLYYLGHFATGVPACSGCHSPKGSGNAPAGFPMLRGQHAAYVVKALGDFKSRERANDPREIMRAVSGKMTSEEMNAVADFISGMSEPR